MQHGAESLTCEPQSRLQRMLSSWYEGGPRSLGTQETQLLVCSGFDLPGLWLLPCCAISTVVCVSAAVLCLPRAPWYVGPIAPILEATCIFSVGERQWWEGRHTCYTNQLAGKPQLCSQLCRSGCREMVSSTLAFEIVFW